MIFINFPNKLVIRILN